VLIFPGGSRNDTTLAECCPPLSPRIHETGVFRQESSLDGETLGDPMCKSNSHLRSVLGVFCQVAQKTPPALRCLLSRCLPGNSQPVSRSLHWLHSLSAKSNATALRLSALVRGSPSQC
jgi:hypothetical protein